MTRIGGICVAALAVATGCAPAAVPSPAASTPAASRSVAASPTLAPVPASALRVLARGTLSRPPDVPLRMNVGHVMQAAGASLTHSHEVAFIYAVNGPTQLVMNGAATDLAAGQAVFVPAGTTHTHADPGSTPNEFFYMSISPASAPPPPPTVKLEYKTPDIAAIPAGATEMMMLRLDLPAGSTYAMKGHALELSYELSGEVLLHRADGTARPLKANEGDHFVGPQPGVTAIDNVGAATATILVLAVDAPAN